MERPHRKCQHHGQESHVAGRYHQKHSGPGARKASLLLTVCFSCYQVRGISTVTQAIANGDMSRKIDVEAKGEILILKETINNMVDRLSIFCNEVQRVAKDVGVDGIMGGQADVAGLKGRWKEITTDVNTMANNLVSLVDFHPILRNANSSSDGPSPSVWRHYKRSH